MLPSYVLRQRREVQIVTRDRTFHGKAYSCTDESVVITGTIGDQIGRHICIPTKDILYATWDRRIKSDEDDG